MTPTPDPPKPNKEAPSQEVRRICSEELFRGEKWIVITHAGTEYRLIKTRNDKLMLQK